MFDVRALLVDRDIHTGDGVCLERIDPPAAPVEEWLRGWLASVSWTAPGATRRFVEQASSLEADTRTLSDAALRQALWRTGKWMQADGFCDAHIARAFAAVREASRRVLMMRHHDVQLLAGRALLQGKVAEMATGEGKTLVAALAACTAAAARASVHVVTVNDYLALRDAEGNEPLFTFSGLTTGVVKQDMPIPERMVQYRCNIVYVSNKELTFEEVDFIRERAQLIDKIGVKALPNSREIKRGSETLRDVRVDGAEPIIADIGKYDIAEGRYFTETENNNSMRVAYIGRDVADKLFPQGDSLGSEITISGIPYRIIGIQTAKGTVFGQPQDVFVQFPIKTFGANFGGCFARFRNVENYDIGLNLFRIN